MFAHSLSFFFPFLAGKIWKVPVEWEVKWLVITVTNDKPSMELQYPQQLTISSFVLQIFLF